MERNSEIFQQYSNWSQGLENDAKEIKITCVVETWGGEGTSKLAPQ